MVPSEGGYPGEMFMTCLMLSAVQGVLEPSVRDYVCPSAVLQGECRWLGKEGARITLNSEDFLTSRGYSRVALA